MLIALTGLCSADSTWTRPDSSGLGDWSLAANWDAVPVADTGYTYTGAASGLAEIQVTGSETYGLRLVHGSTSPSSSVSAVLRIKSGGSLSQGTYSTGSHSYVGKVNNAKMIIEAGATFSTNAKLYISTYAGSVGTVDVAGILDLSNGWGELNFGDTYPSTATGLLNVLDGGIVKVTTFDTGLSGIQQPMSATSIIDIQGTGKIVDAGYSLAQANTLIASGQVAGNGILGSVVASYDTVLNETTITAVILDALSVDVGADQYYKRGAVPLTLEATIVDDGIPATAVLTWSQTDGPGAATFASPNSAATDVTFNAAGVYTLRLTADNTAGGGSEVVYDDLEVTVSNPTCQDVIDANLLLAADVNGDCYVNLADVAEVLAAWLNCSNPQDAGCDWSYPVLTLVHDGQPMAVIVIGADASTTEQYAAEELQLYLEKISGATVPIVTEGIGEMPATAIVIGTPNTCQYVADSGLIAESSLGRDGILIKTVDNIIILAGENPPGALYATYAFLEEHLGCRWYFPGAKGEYVPAMTTIATDRIDDTQKPAMEFRGIHMVGPDTDDPEIATWMARNRMSFISQVVFEPHHRARVNEHIKKGLVFNTETHFSHWLGGGALFAAHPEYFPLLDGVRTEGFPSGYGEGLQQHNYCLSNLDLVTEVANAIRDYVELYPEVEIIGINQQDSVRWCESEPCVALGGPTDRLHTFINRLVEELGPVLDNRVLSTQAYLGTDALPTNVIPNEKLVIQYALISHCARHGWNENCPTQEAQKAMLAGWLGYGNKIIAYTYHANQFPGFALPMAYHSLDAMKYYKEIGMSGWYPETAADVPGQNPLGRDPDQLFGDQWYSEKELYYTAAKALWNSRVTLGEIKDDFFPKFYGAAGPAMRNYYDALEEAWHYPGDVLYLHKRILGYNPNAVIDFLNPTLINTMNGYLDEAVVLSEEESDVVKDRVDRDIGCFFKWEQRYDETGGVATAQ